MSPDFLLGLAIGLVAASAGLIFHTFRSRPSEIIDWTEDAYRPRKSEPRAVTRITSKDIEWEVK